MKKAIIHYLNTNATLEECGKLFKCDRKKLSKIIKENYSNFNKIKFINISNIVHNNKFDYSLVENFKKVKDKVTIICPKHGKFSQEVYSHKRGCDCQLCNIEKLNNNNRQSKEDFLKKSKEIHGNRYSYSNTEYIDDRTKVIISCNFHGNFLQTPNAHKQGKGCMKCTKENIGWTKKKWKNKGKERKAKVYIIKCFNENEEFIKIGRTFNTIKKRFASKSELPYNYEIIRIFESFNYNEIWDKEIFLHRKYKDFKYLPKIHFKGKHECFSIEILKELETI